MKRMADPARSRDERFTYGDYRRWPDDERWELIDGVAYSMCAAPLRFHQGVIGKIYTALEIFLEGKSCRVYIAPFDVLLPRGDEADDDVDTVVEPDIVVYCDRSKLTRAGARGAPDLVVEALSPSTSKKDQNEKFELYERHRVREYWIVDPEGSWLCVYRLETPGSGKPRFDSGELRERERGCRPVSSRVLEGFTIDPARLFADLD